MFQTTGLRPSPRVERILRVEQSTLSRKRQATEEGDGISSQRSAARIGARAIQCRMIILFSGAKNKWLLSGLVIPSAFVIRASSFQFAYATPQHSAKK